MSERVKSFCFALLLFLRWIWSSNRLIVVHQCKSPLGCWNFTESSKFDNKLLKNSKKIPMGCCYCCGAICVFVSSRKDACVRSHVGKEIYGARPVWLDESYNECGLGNFDSAMHACKHGLREKKNIIPSLIIDLLFIPSIENMLIPSRP